MLNLYRIIIDALFPISSADKELFSYTPEQAFKKLPPAPLSPISYTHSIFAYKDELVTRLVWNIKYKKSEKAVKIGGYALYQNIARYHFRSDELQRNEVDIRKITLIPIPITSKRRKERGYNQCELLLDEVKLLDIENKLIIRKDLLERIQHLSRQTLKNREERLESAKNIFAVNEKTVQMIRDSQISVMDDLVHKENQISLRNIPLIVIDDVITTGSTMKEAMKTLREFGFKNVKGISLAH
ncbi:MAG: phosphoribosyltransferase family protein [Candidatus Paceibacterota bacterium]